ncbi:hydrophobin, mutated [Phlebiopsis gigantea 11061_1 CR5-6]|uniref:Hydrophobin n=1 Tax=Phlebiopsis gigantea (strain 11061_1 CR5-6) TaxID=745531 RepID=A0A0C3SFE2_PHLG1|nr:hydrophobin, mutated [Phlebiopsis gigantea 11061_1 CR5-6]
MFSRLTAFSVLALPLFAAATPAMVARNDQPTSPTTACCDSTESANSAVGAALLGLLGIDLSDLNVLLGLTCSPISVVGVGSGTECSGTTVSCTNGVVGGIGIGCVPVSL